MGELRNFLSVHAALLLSRAGEYSLALDRVWNHLATCLPGLSWGVVIDTIFHHIIGP